MFDCGKLKQRKAKLEKGAGGVGGWGWGMGEWVLQTTILMISQSH